MEQGSFGFIDQDDKRFNGNQRLVCELTLRDGKVAYDLNGRAADAWDKPSRSSK